MIQSPIALALLVLCSGASLAAPMPALDQVIDAAPGFSGVVLVGNGSGLIYRRSRAMLRRRASTSLAMSGAGPR